MNEFSPWTKDAASAEAAWCESLVVHVPALRRYAAVLTRQSQGAGERLVQECLRKAIDHGHQQAPEPEKLRAVFMLVCVEEFSYREAAETLGVSVGTVMSRVFRARETLRSAMEDRNG